MEGNENKRVYVADLAEKLALANVPHITVFDLMQTIYNYMSECYTHSAILEKTRAVKVLTDSISQELLAELEGLEP